MRVLFLDFDGVLHPTGTAPGSCLPFEWLPVLEQALGQWPDVSVVVHSSWREQFELEDLREFLSPLGTRVVAVAPPGPRAAAISHFLAKTPSVRSFLVLDDSAAEFSPELTAHLLLCDPATGISALEVQEKLIAWLAAAPLPSAKGAS